MTNQTLGPVSMVNVTHNDTMLREVYNASTTSYTTTQEMVFTTKQLTTETVTKTLVEAIVNLVGKVIKSTTTTTEKPTPAPVLLRALSTRTTPRITTSTAPPIVVPSVWEEERTRSGIPIRYIWIPYVLLSMIILALMILSFMKFHKKHGHKYLRRREDMLRNTNLQQQQQQQQQRQQNQVPNHPPRGVGVALSPRGVAGGHHLPPNGGPNASHSVHYHHPSSSHNSHNPRGANHTTVKKTSNPRRHKPLTFARNANGSMVDLRVAGNDSISMFKTSFAPTIQSEGIWTLPKPKPIKHRHRHRPPYSTISSPSACFSDEDDDNVLLIHQSKV